MFAILVSYLPARETIALRKGVSPTSFLWRNEESSHAFREQHLERLARR